MGTIRIALAQVNVVVGDLEGNARVLCSMIDRAREAQADVVVFPELAVTGAPPEDLLRKRWFLDETCKAMVEVARSCVGLVAVVGYVEQGLSGRRMTRSSSVLDRLELYNAAAIAANGQCLASYRKQVLNTENGREEERYFLAGRSGLVIELQSLTIGVSIGDELWCPPGPVPALLEAHADMIVNISAIPFVRGGRLQREQALVNSALRYNAMVAHVNLVGGQDGLVFDGGSLVVDRNGEIVARAKAFEDDLLIADLHFERRVDENVCQSPSKNRHEHQHEGQWQQITISMPRRVAPLPPIVPRVEPRGDDLEETYQALVRGVKDYAAKNGFVNVVLGLSGGIDSALTAAVAVDALGAEHVVGLCMPSPYTSVESAENAVELARRLAMKCLTIPITPLFEAFRHSLAQAFQEAPVGQTEENLQARIRGMILMAFSNQFGHLVLTTGNKSEMSVGYATLYGDTAGGFAVLKDVPKTMVYELARLRNRQGPVPVI
ncbi:MAG: NAD+ synthase, partial [Nitrospira sp.]